jgi:hypothetical protein
MPPSANRKGRSIAYGEQGRCQRVTDACAGGTSVASVRTDMTRRDDARAAAFEADDHSAETWRVIDQEKRRQLLETWIRGDRDTDAAIEEQLARVERYRAEHRMAADTAERLAAANHALGAIDGAIRVALSRE